MSISTHLANKVLDAICNNVSLSYANLYISLHTDNPGDTGTNEVTAGSNTYARKETEPADWDDAGSKKIETLSVFEYEDMPSANVTYIGVWDAPSNGNWLGGGELTDPKSVDAGETLRFKEGEISIEVDPT